MGLEETDEERRFKLTAPQKAAFTKLKMLLTKTTPVESAEMSAAVVDATYALTACRLGGEEDGEDHPIVAYTILKNTKPGNIIAAPDKVGPTLAPPQYIMKSAVYLKMRQRVLESNGALSLFDAYENEEQWLKEGKDTPYAYIRQTVHLAGFWGHQVTRMPRFKWEKTGTHFWYNGQRFSYRDFKVMLGMRVHNLQVKFLELCQLFDIPPELLAQMEDLKEMADNQDKRSTRYSFLDDDANLKWMGNVKAVMDHVVDKLKLCVRTGKEGIKFFPDKVKIVLEKCKEFLKHLLAVMYLTGGQPPRGSELTHALFRNIETRIRNIYVEMGHMVNVGFLNKTSYALNADKPIPRGFPPQISFVLANYLMLIRPIEHLLSLGINTTKTVDEIDMALDHVFCHQGKLLDTSDLTDILEEYTKEDMHARDKLGTSDMRQILISIAMRHVCPQEGGEEYRARTDLQGGHVSHLARLHYGVEMGRISPNLTQEVMNAFVQVSRDHHIAFGLVDKDEYNEVNAEEIAEAEVSEECVV